MECQEEGRFDVQKEDWKRVWRNAICRVAGEECSALSCLVGAVYSWIAASTQLPLQAPLGAATTHGHDAIPGRTALQMDCKLRYNAATITITRTRRTQQAV